MTYVEQDAFIEMSGTPREPAGIGVEPAGRVPWYDGRANTLLNPPPAPFHAVSRWPALSPWQSAGPCVESTVLPVVTSVHRLVPPTPVTNGSDEGQPTSGVGSSLPPLPTGCLGEPVLPSSPELARKVIPCCVPEMKACRRFWSEALDPKDPSAAPKLWVTTSARWWSTTYCSAFIMAGKPCTPRVSAVGVATSSRLAPGATVWAYWRSRATSTDQALLASRPGDCEVPGISFTWWLPKVRVSMWGIPGVQVTSGSPHISGRP